MHGKGNTENDEDNLDLTILSNVACTAFNAYTDEDNLDLTILSNDGDIVPIEIMMKII